MEVLAIFAAKARDKSTMYSEGIDMGVSMHGGTPKWMVYTGKSHSNG